MDVISNTTASVKLNLINDVSPNFMRKFDLDYRTLILEYSAVLIRSGNSDSDSRSHVGPAALYCSSGRMRYDVTGWDAEGACPIYPRTKEVDFCPRFSEHFPHFVVNPRGLFNTIRRFLYAIDFLRITEALLRMCLVMKVYLFIYLEWLNSAIVIIELGPAS